MKLEIVKTGDPVLRTDARDLTDDEISTPFVQELIASMKQTMRDAPGVGLAANQVGEAMSIFVMWDSERFLDDMSEARREELGREPFDPMVIVNPVLVPLGDEISEYFEGCLSIDGLMALVPRFASVRLSGKNERGESVELELHGWKARIAQHEFDHLRGVLYVDRMQSRSFTTQSNVSRFWKARPSTEIRAAVGID